MIESMSTDTELQTIRDFVRFATSRFNEAGLYYGHGTDNAWDEALALVLHALHLTHHMDSHILDSRLTQNEKQHLLEMIERRVQERIPVAYLTHETWFANLSFYVDERVIIPRSPIAELILNYFDPWLDIQDVHDVLDLCTGSGCIAIACAKAAPHIFVDAVDISEDALAVAKINVLRHSVENQVKLFRGDLFEAIPKKKYDLIISNPPYVNKIELSGLPPEYKHEPQLALAGGDDGLKIIARILNDAEKYLKPNGVLIVETGNAEEEVIKQFPYLPFTWLEFEQNEGGVFLLEANQLKTVSKKNTFQTRG